MKRILPLILLAFALGGCADVHTSNRGIVLSWNKPTGEVKDEGMYPAFSMFGYDIKEMTVGTVNHEIKGQGATSDRQVVDVTVAIAYHLDPDPKKLSSLYEKMQNGYEETIIDPGAHELIKATTARFNQTNLIAKRNDVRDQIAAELKKQFGPYGIVVEQVNITQLSFDKEYQQSIEETAMAQQKQAQAIIESTTASDKAKIDNATKIANANADATANRARQQTLTPMLLQAEAIKTWDGHLPQVMSGSTPFINLKKAGD